MPMLFLSPSTQEYNIYYDGSGSEEYYMNLIADYMEPYLTASGITFTRNNPEGSVGDSVRLSNAGDYALHLALHSNASGSANYGRQTGSDVYYYPTSVNGKRAADIFVTNLKRIYPDPNKVRALPTTRLYELNNTRAPSILVELAYHDNQSDAEWIKSNLQLIAENLAQSVADYFGLPLVKPNSDRYGTVVTEGGRLNIREQPNLEARILGQIPNGATVKINGQTGAWYMVSYNGINGYSYGQYIKIK
ncbi:MAG: N-acetylmuramoyl-L-alanine amidase [Clostridia bacterium]|nr:N-acetylmuramoyl-L-alanine amidase [Clostridia bacterium]